MWFEFYCFSTPHTPSYLVYRSCSSRVGCFLAMYIYVFILSLVTSARCVSLLPSFPPAWLDVFDTETAMVHVLATGPCTLRSGLAPHLLSGSALDQPTLLHLQLQSEVGRHHCSKCVICLPWFLQILHLQSFFSCLKKLKTSGMTSDCAQWNVNHAQPCCGAEQSMACMRSRVAKCKHSVSCPAPTQLGNFCWCKWSRHKHCSACYYYIIESDWYT